MKCDAIVIGGGVVGLSAALCLLEAGLKQVLILERQVLASGGTGLGTGSVHTQRWFATDSDLVLRSKHIISQISERSGGVFQLFSVGRLTVVGEADAQIRNSDGASVSSMQSLSVYANSHGFFGRERGTHHSVGCALIAGQGDGMQRDGWYTSALAREDLEDVGLVGRRAAERTVARLQPRSLATGSMPVLFAPEVARSLVGHLLSAVSDGALYRQASFLLDSVGQRLFPEWMQIDELPHLRRGLRSAAFDGDGVATRASALVRDGVLQRYVLGSYSARKLGLQTTANAGGVHNLQLTANAGPLEEIARQMGDGLLVTELMGQGVNGVTGDYSRGAGGFRVENGEIQYPVDGVTIAGNLREMFSTIEAVGSDVDPRSHIRTGSILLGRMTIAGND